MLLYIALIISYSIAQECNFPDDKLLCEQDCAENLVECLRSCSPADNDCIRNCNRDFDVTCVQGEIVDICNSKDIMSICRLSMQ